MRSLTHIWNRPGCNGLSYAENLRKKIDGDRTLIICDINQDAMERFQDQTRGLGPVKAVGTAREALQEAVRDYAISQKIERPAYLL